MTRAHTDAVLTLLRAVTNLNVHDATVPDHPALPYVVVRTSSGPRSRSSLLATSDRFELGVWCTSVGATREQAQWAVERVVAALLDVRPAVASRQCFPIEHIVSRPIERDDDVTPPLLYAVDEFRLVSIPA